MSEYPDRPVDESSPADSSSGAASPSVTSSDAETPWQWLADAEPIRIRDPLAELLGMVPEGEPLVVSFADVATAAGHACPAVAGAYRSTQLALDELYPDRYPVRSDVEVIVGGRPDASGLGPMADVVSHVTGAADERGFTGFGGYGGRANLLSFDESVASEDGRTFEFTRTDADLTVRVSFDAGAMKNGPQGEEGGEDEAVLGLIPKLIAGEVSDEKREQFYETWHGRVQKILTMDPGPESPFSLEREE